MPTEPKLTAGEWFLAQGLSQELQYWRRDHVNPNEPYPIKTKDLVGLLTIINRLSKEELKEGCDTCVHYLDTVTGENATYMPCAICRHCMASQYKKKENPDA